MLPETRKPLPGRSGPQEMVLLGGERFLSSTTTFTKEDLAALVARRHRLCLPLARVVIELADLGARLA